MFSLNFYPQSDVYHTAFRAIAVAKRAGPLAIDAYRIFDYFILNPFELSIVRNRGSAHKQLAASFEGERPYKWKAEPASVLLQMIDYQSMAISTLLQRSILDAENYKIGNIALSTSYVPNEDFRSSLEKFIAGRDRIFLMLESLTEKYGLNGEGGLKERTGLIDHRYDVKQHDIFD